MIIAEAGVNHNGSIEKAKELIDAAADAGADLVKFQTFQASKLVSAKAPKAAYQTRNDGNGNTQFDMLKKLELSYQQHLELIEHCALRSIRFFSTAFDHDSVDQLAHFKLRLWKIPSGEITNLPYLEKIGKFNDSVIISTGMCTMDEILDAINVIVASGTDRTKITVLHCNTEYPTPMQDVNLKAMQSIGKITGLPVGYSDHTLGIEVPIAAVALGAVVIEKHFTLDRRLPGPDHAASLEPFELKAMVAAIRNIERALGSEKKEPTPSELKNLTVARKSIHLARALPAGSLLHANDLEMKRPGDGISPMKLKTVIGRKIKYDLPADHKLSERDIL